MRTLIFMVFLIVLSASCTEEDSNVDWFYGEWKVRDATWTLVNGIQGPMYVQEYYLEFNAENCGAKYDLDKEATNDIKWVFERGEDRHDYHFLLSTVIGSSSGSNDLTRGNLYFVSQFNEEKMKLTRRYDRISNDTTFNTIWSLTLTKQ